MGQLLRDLDLTLVTAAGVVVPQKNGLLNLVDGTTYYAEVPAAGEAGLVSVQWCFGALLVATINYETTNLPPSDASVNVAAGALWYPEDEIDDLVTAAAAGTFMQHLVNLCSRRCRAKIVVTTGGAAQLRGRPHLKVGA